MICEPDSHSGLPPYFSTSGNLCGSVWFCVDVSHRCVSARRSAETEMIFLCPSGRRKQTVPLFHGSTSVSVFPVTSCFGSDLATSSHDALSSLSAPLALQRAIVKLKPPSNARGSRLFLPLAALTDRGELLNFPCFIDKKKTRSIW